MTVHDGRGLARCRRFEGRVVRDGRHVSYAGRGGRLIGYGHLCNGVWPDDEIGVTESEALEAGLTEGQAEALLRWDWERSGAGVGRLLAARGIADLDGPRRAALTEMAFQLGVGGCKGFGKMWDALAERDWATTAAEARDSLWCRRHPTRAGLLADILESGDDG